MENKRNQKPGKTNLYLYQFVTIIIVLFAVFTSGGCDNDSITNSVNTPVLGGYDVNEAGINMTLAAISYAAMKNPSDAEIRDSIILQLSDTSYTTMGKWKLAWGPGISPGKGNLMYVAVDSTRDTIYYTIAIRGTVWKFPSNVEEDMRVWKLNKYPYGGTGDSVAAGSLSGLDTLLKTTDPLTGRSLGTFLDSIKQGKLKMFITGHSLGGALATMLSAWFMDNNYASKFHLKVYTFASPSVGNESFVNRYNSMIQGVNAESHRVVNSKDIVPYGWSNIPGIITNQIPTLVPLEIVGVLGLVTLYLNDKGIVYKDVDTKRDISYYIPMNCSGGSNTDKYFCWIAFEHDHNNYLRLLNAKPVKF